MDTRPRPKKKMGRPKEYAGERDGAPKLTVRLAPDVYERVTTRSEGARLYVERLVREDKDREQTVVED